MRDIFNRPEWAKEVTEVHLLVHEIEHMLDKYTDLHGRLPVALVLNYQTFHRFRNNRELENAGYYSAGYKQRIAESEDKFLGIRILTPVGEQTGKTLVEFI